MSSQTRNIVLLRDTPPSIEADLILSAFTFSTTKTESADGKERNDNPQTIKPTAAKADNNDTWYITFLTENDAINALNYIRTSHGKTIDGRPIRACLKGTAKVVTEPTVAPISMQASDNMSSKVYNSHTPLHQSANCIDVDGTTGKIATNVISPQPPYHFPHYDTAAMNSSNLTNHGYNVLQYNIPPSSTTASMSVTPGIQTYENHGAQNMDARSDHISYPNGLTPIVTPPIDHHSPPSNVTVVPDMIHGNTVNSSRASFSNPIVQQNPLLMQFYASQQHQPQRQHRRAVSHGSVGSHQGYYHGHHGHFYGGDDYYYNPTCHVFVQNNGTHKGKNVRRSSESNNGKFSKAKNSVAIEGNTTRQPNGKMIKGGTIAFTTCTDTAVVNSVNQSAGENHRMAVTPPARTPKGEHFNANRNTKRNGKERRNNYARSRSLGSVNNTGVLQLPPVHPATPNTDSMKDVTKKYRLSKENGRYEWVAKETKTEETTGSLTKTFNHHQGSNNNKKKFHKQCSKEQPSSETEATVPAQLKGCDQSLLEVSDSSSDSTEKQESSSNYSTAADNHNNIKKQTRSNKSKKHTSNRVLKHNSNTENSNLNTKNNSKTNEEFSWNITNFPALHISDEESFSIVARTKKSTIVDNNRQGKQIVSNVHEEAESKRPLETTVTSDMPEGKDSDTIAVLSGYAAALLNTSQSNSCKGITRSTTATVNSTPSSSSTSSVAAYVEDDATSSNGAEEGMLTMPSSPHFQLPATMHTHTITTAALKC